MNYEQFTEKYPGYENTLLDELRQTEFPQLGNAVYADWTGGAIPPRSLIAGHSDFLLSNLLGNPHSKHSASMKSMEMIESARARIYQYFNTTSNDYTVIFTSNATSAIMLLQHFMFDGGEILLTADNHNSINGLGAIARCKGADVRYAPITGKLELNYHWLASTLTKKYYKTGHRLFCFPAKSNYTGHKHDLQLVTTAQNAGWRVLLDAASYLANNRLDLSVVRPDFIPVSLYKLYGLTGVGCMLVRNDAFSTLNKRWFAGGTILMASVAGLFFVEETLNYARHEEGTLNYSYIPLVVPGLDFMDRIGDVSQRASAVASHIYESIDNYSVGGKYVKVYNNPGFDTVAFNIVKDDIVQSPALFEIAANEEGLLFRTGCFCNPGVNETALCHNPMSYHGFKSLPIPKREMTLKNFGEKYDVPIGAIRASFGYLNNFSDAERIISFIKKYLEQI